MSPTQRSPAVPEAWVILSVIGGTSIICHQLYTPPCPAITVYLSCFAATLSDTFLQKRSVVDRIDDVASLLQTAGLCGKEPWAYGCCGLPEISGKVKTLHTNRPMF